jgi:hypothetical protein
MRASPGSTTDDPSMHNKLMMSKPCSGTDLFMHSGLPRFSAYAKMRYMWGIFRYSKLLSNAESHYSYCNTHLDPLGQIVVHSHCNSRSVRKERWLHVTSKDNRAAELILSSDSVELRLNVVLIRSRSVVILEKVWLEPGASVCARERLVGYKHGHAGFQLMFYSKEEADAFSDRLGVMMAKKVHPS